MTRKGRRLAMIGAAGVVLASAVGLVLYSLGGTMSYFAAPSDIVGKAFQPGQRWRLGGLVEQGSLTHDGASEIAFKVTDTNKSIKVIYSGIVPDLFREGQGVVAEGVVDASGVFQADTLLAKHDEKYMPKEVADALKAQGHWQEGSDYGKKP
ncbi:cytochrome c-type biogenesis protein CcmE [Labrys miyagiensis]|uniref:Cytochrome c-type biogenesis protein CcmE n=1 Tax=Labrys miyagiensis TaxID=346912 RepID=A0ABQ6CTG5_9HYPH|nr:cytochrome c maturation protein CcmE [Labrys miyagiensis]GLS22867.1 cytochrome c-type biogenesis protein CcmE [Labrys miyagiensis]